MQRTIVAAAIFLTIAGNLVAAEWFVNKHVAYDPRGPKISLPNHIEAQFTPGTKAKKNGLGDETVAQAVAAFRVKTDAGLLRSIRCEYSILLKARNGRIYSRGGYAYRTQESVADINTMKDSVIQEFSIKPMTQIIGYRFGLYHRNFLMDEVAWTRSDILARGYDERWYER